MELYCHLHLSPSIKSGPSNLAGGLLTIALDMTDIFPIVCLGVCRDPHCTYLYSSWLQQCAAPPVGVRIRKFIRAGDVGLYSVGGAI